MSSPAPAIEADGLGRDYNGVRALGRLSLTVPRGAMVGLLGPNGAGKTTAMLLLATLLAPSRGSVRILGFDTRRHRSIVRRRLGLVFQETSVDGLLTVEENLRFAARLAGLGGRAATAAVAAAITEAGLAPRAAQLARQLSGGWRRLVDVARATMHRPDLLILDEPTVGLDPEHRERIWAILEDHRRQHGTTILFSTHYLAEAEPADRVILLARGEVVADGAPLELQASVGDEVAEIDGAGAEHLVALLRDRGAVVGARRTERGFRVGLRRGGVRPMELAAGARDIERLAVRPVTLEDVYFAKTDAERA
ncbi:MAG: ABC transporter ATP-binding protein [Gemmatimonadales bacterium]